MRTLIFFFFSFNAMPQRILYGSHVYIIILHTYLLTQFIAFYANGLDFGAPHAQYCRVSVELIWLKLSYRGHPSSSLISDPILMCISSSTLHWIVVGPKASKDKLRLVQPKKKKKKKGMNEIKSDIWKYVFFILEENKIWKIHTYKYFWY